MTETLPERFAARMGQLLGPDFPNDIALAVSGGGDSMAMLALTHDWARVFGVRLRVVTIDHGLRAQSVAEAAMVAKECAALGHPHDTLRWTWDGQGNLQDAARRARLELIDSWRDGIAHVLMAHTRDDVAETFLMRLARGSGVEGLSAMAERRVVHGVTGRFEVIRPLLTEARAELRHHIDVLHVPYVDDPSNEDLRFDRVKARSALAALGIDASALGATAQRMDRARHALQARAAQVARDIVAQDDALPDVLSFDRDGFAAVERDTQLRLLAGGLCWTSSTAYRPRASASEALLDRVLAGGGGTLHGAQVEVGRHRIEIFRELAAVERLRCAVDGVAMWDRRWLLYGPAIKGLEVRALGDAGWRQLSDAAPEVDGDALPPPRHAIARTRPAVFDGDRFVAFAPYRFGPDYMADFKPKAGQFITFLESR